MFVSLLVKTKPLSNSTKIKEKRCFTKTSALSLILNFEGIFWFNIFQSKYVDAEKYIDEISNYILYAYTQEGDK